jgi:sugar (pentulose or hexulose) kinase
MLRNLETLDWDDELLGFFDIPRAMLPQIRPSSDPNGYGEVAAPAGFAGIPLTGILGDQQAAMFGQVCFALGEAKNTYGTGNFMLLNTGTDLVRSKNGLLRTGCSERVAQHCLLPGGHGQAGLRPGGFYRGHRFGGAVAARPAGHHFGALARSRPWQRA